MSNSFFWSSIKKGYIEPKRVFQAIGIVDFVEPFLIQSMDKPSVKLKNIKANKVLKNGTLKVENHYQSGYELNTIKVEILDVHDEGSVVDLNKSQTLYNLLTDGGYTARANDFGPARFNLRFPTFLILELAPEAADAEKAAWNAGLSATGGAVEALIAGGNISSKLGGAMDAVSTGLQHLNPDGGPRISGVWTFKDPVISSVDFGGSFSYGSDEFVKISLTFDYNNFKYEKSLV